MRGKFIIILVLGLAVSPTVRGQPTSTSADEFAALGLKEYAAGDTGSALRDFKTAFTLAGTPLNASRVALASSYASKLSAAFPELRTWLLLKKVDAQKLGDRDSSWEQLDDVLKGFEAQCHWMESEVSRLTSLVADKDAEIEKLKKELENTRAQLDAAKEQEPKWWEVGHDAAEHYRDLPDRGE